MIVLSADLGTVNLGFAVTEYNGNRISYLYSEYFKNSGKTLEVKLLNIYNRFLELIIEYKPTVIVYEKPVFNSRGAVGAAINNVEGVLILLGALHNIKSCWRTVREVKLSVGEFGNCDKSKIMEGISRHIPSLEGKVYKKDHESDAIAVGITHILKEIENGNLL